MAFENATLKLPQTCVEKNVVFENATLKLPQTCVEKNVVFENATLKLPQTSPSPPNIGKIQHYGAGGSLALGCPGGKSEAPSTQKASK
ncbi:MAG: hypothetical protein OHK0053_30540 [Microscillaceae bacterium]